MKISAENCYDIELEDLPEDLTKAKELLNKGVKDAFVCIVLSGGMFTRTKSDIDIFMERLGYDMSKIEANINKLYNEAISKLEIDVNIYLNDNYDMKGYRAILKTARLFTHTDVIMLLTKE